VVGSVSVPVRLAVVLTIGFPAAAFATNCYVLAPGAGQECLVVDPGIGVEDHLAQVLREHRLKPAAVLLTHGHLDHVYSSSSLEWLDFTDSRPFGEEGGFSGLSDHVPLIARVRVPA